MMNPERIGYIGRRLSRGDHGRKTLAKKCRKKMFVSPLATGSVASGGSRYCVIRSAPSVSIAVWSRNQFAACSVCSRVSSFGRTNTKARAAMARFRIVPRKSTPRYAGSCVASTATTTGPPSAGWTPSLAIRATPAVASSARIRYAMVTPSSHPNRRRSHASSSRSYSALNSVPSAASTMASGYPWKERGPSLGRAPARKVPGSARPAHCFASTSCLRRSGICR